MPSVEPDLLDLGVLSLPFIIILVGMIGFKWSALRAGLVALLVTLPLVWLYLGASGYWLARELLPGSVLEAGITSLSILWIIFGALCIYYAQHNSGAIQRIQQTLARLHPDPRVSALFIAWFFSMFMEGAAGFGTSAALTAPFLVAAGYRPVMAVVLALWGHSLGVAFGAVGTPVITQALLVPEPQLLLTRAVLPFMVPTTFVLAIALAWGCLRYGPAQSVSDNLSTAQGDGEAPARSQAKLTEAFYLGALAAICFLIPAAVMAYWLGPELPTLLGAVAGAVLFALLTARKGRNLPESESGSFFIAIAPYAILIVLVLITRLVPDIKAFLQAVQWQVEWQGYRGNIAYLYHPGTLLLVSFLLGGLVQRQSFSMLKTAAVQAFLRILTVIAALFVMLLLSRLLVHSGAIGQLGQQVAAIAGTWWPFWAPLFGVLGTFITGSATSSNILFSEFQRSAAQAGGYATPPLLGSQTFGAAVGNMVCPHNIIAAGATVDIHKQEGQVMKYTLPMAALLTAIAGAMAMFIL
ncbi:MAG: L-lactate permease [Idiomarina sp.]|nr:L-lactate permease [Idiomarina sp.]